MTLNSFEAVWQCGPHASRLVATRNDAFDFRAGLFHATIDFEWDPLGRPNGAFPTIEWVRDALQAFVRDEFGARANPRQFPETINQTRGTATCSLRSVAAAHQAWAERTYVYDARAQSRLAELVAREPEPRRRLHELLITTPIGARENRKNLTAEDFENRVLPEIDLRVGARLIAMGLPFRDQNPFRTNDSPSAATMAEAAFLIQMHTAALALYQVFPTGSTVTIVADGRFYAEALGTTQQEAGHYLENLRKLRNDLNMQGTVSIIDLRDVVDRFSSRGNDRHLFDDTAAAIEIQLRKLLSEDGGHAGLLRSVEFGMRWNYCTRQFAEGLNRREFWGWLHGEPFQGSVFGELDRKIIEAAIRYTAMNIALRYHSVVPTMLPGFIRASVHPKQLQVGLSRLGSVSPWNGVAYMKDGTPESLRVLPLHEVPIEAKEYRSNEYVEDSIAFYA